jgi:radical SAM protein with 4Fe4S-binding SPASM domain
MTELQPELLTEPLPSILWIELTSTCPFDCIFCSRKLRRGNGEHMPFPLYRSLIEQLRDPRIIRLNYSGESIHYPFLVEAIELAGSTGAFTELVTAFASIPPALIEPLARSGLGGLSISLHTLDGDQFRRIYRYSTLERLQSRLGEFVRSCDGVKKPPRLNFAFVAMDSNLEQLGAVADFAARHKADGIFVHPVLKRDPILVEFPAELDNNQRLTAGFKARLNDAVNRAGARHPEVSIVVANPDVSGGYLLGAIPAPYPGPLPPGAYIRTCEQNPWDTIHVLANGDVVVCEVLDKEPLGNLARESLREIWHGGAYAQFRRRYVHADVPECRNCPWKSAYVPAAPEPYIMGGDRHHAQLFQGWYDNDDGEITWSRPRARATVRRVPGANRLRLAGILPHGPKGNTLRVFCDGKPIGTVRNSATSPSSFDITVGLEGSSGFQCELAFEVSRPFRPSREGWGIDQRDLGFALIAVEAKRVLRGWPRMLRYAILIIVFAFAALRRAVRRRGVCTLEPFSPGISVIVPERGNPALLRECLASVRRELASIEEPGEVIVVVNGSDASGYRHLVEEFPELRWRFHDDALGFSRAIECGLAQARYDWVYLLNNDMTLEPGAFQSLLGLRAHDVFAIGSQIVLRDPACHEESNWTGFYLDDGIFEIFDRPPVPGDSNVHDSFYAGGGSSLFRRSVLAGVIESSKVYDPFYWEDVEWGTAARRLGYRVLFCPVSKVLHHRRATVSKFYTQEEIDRIFRRNALLYQVRNFPEGVSAVKLLRRIVQSDTKTFREILCRSM